MEGSVVDNLRSRSRSRSNTPLLQAHPEPTPRLTEFETVPEIEPEIFTSPPAHRTRNALKQKTTIIEQGNESSNFTLANDIISPITKDNFLSEEIAQNIKNYSYEYEQTTSTHTSSWQVINGNRAHSSFTSPYDSHRRNNSGTSHSRLSSSCSIASNESFAESVLADSSKLSYEGVDHLPYRLYKFAIEYWNKYPKTDYTYSHLSRDRVELAPGQIAVPNMSRLSLAQYRQGASVYNGGLDEDESAALLSRCQELRQRKNTETTYSQSTQFRSDNLIDSDYDETDTYASRYAASVNSSNNRWWITRLLITIMTTITTATTTVKNKILRRDTNQRYPYYSTRHSAYSENKSIFTAVKETAKKRKWLILFFLLLLLPLLYWLYGLPIVPVMYFNKNVTIIEKPVHFELTEEILKTIVLHVKDRLTDKELKPQIIERIIESSNSIDPSILNHQQDLIDKLNLEIESLKEKLVANEMLEEQIALLMLKHNLVNDDLETSNSKMTKIFDDVKDWVKQEAVSKHDMDVRVADAVQLISNKLNREIPNIVKDSLAQQENVILANSNTGLVNHGEATCNCNEIVEKIVRDAITLYDADKTGKVDYALESAGGQVISTRCSESYQPRTAVYTVLGIPVWYPSNSPRTVLMPGTSPGECWAFQGFPGYLVIKLHTRIYVTGFTLEHTPIQLSPTGRIDSAPKNFTVLGLQDEMDHEPVVFGKFEYRNDSSAIQYFAVDSNVKIPPEAPEGFEILELRIESNHGHPHHTCVYRFRVHGTPVGDISNGNIPER